MSDETKTKSKTKPTYRVVRGIDYPKGKRAEPGDEVNDIPESSVPWLLEHGHIEEVA